MKTTIVLILTGWVINLATICDAQYQAVVGQPMYPMYGSYSSTAEESYLRGQADMVRAQGAWMLSFSQAMVNYEEARRRATENHVAGVKAYYQLREEHRKARGAERSRETVKMQALVQPAKKVAPAARQVVSPIDNNGQIVWPEPLQAESFAVHRKQLGTLAVQFVTGGALNAAQRESLNNVRQATLNELKHRAAEISSRDYFTALQFVKSLADTLDSVDRQARVAAR